MTQATGFEWPEDIEQFLRKCLTRDPARRYQSAREARQALEKVRDRLDRVREDAYELIHSGGP